ncbi:MAG: LysR substrate-binding domain-containing protein [Terrimicrobiaceae bacterium]
MPGRSTRNTTRCSTQFFATLDGRPNIAVECDGATSLLAAVESGRGVAIVPEIFRSLAGSRVKLRRIEPTPPPMIVGCAS